MSRMERMTDTREQIEHEFKADGLSSIDAIERLERIGFSPKDAEALVDEWDNTPQ